ncbi:DUF6153 family protein [Streptomyces sp. NPDC047869]|uniref:DUF6153 family protein n=1 Tax=Streptomyces sp. NPDC047869 TaxID=3154709 RepID=UPI0034546CD0
MPGNQQRAPRPPRRSRRALLVLAVVAGLLGMHALAPGGGTGHPARAQAQHHAVAVMAQDACPDGHCGGGHLHHADPSCASGAVKDGPQPPVLVPGPVTVRPPAGARRSLVAAAPDGARAPPTLAELQLLRI